MNDALVSIIIPVYNGERYIKNSINSLIKQTYTNIEIIVVDDGSTDNTIDILNSINDTRLKVFSKKNEGVSKARNYGINKATGDFIMFCDADDNFKEEAIEEIIKKQLETNADIIRFNGFIQDKKEIYREIELPVDNDYLLNSNENIKEIIDVINAPTKSVRCYSPLLFLKNDNIIKFNEKLSYLEDKIFYLENMLVPNKKIIFMDKKLYYYNYNAQSKTKNIDIFYKNILDMLDSKKELEKILSKYEYNQEDINITYCSLTISLIDYLISCCNYTEYKKNIIKLKENYEIREIFLIDSNRLNKIRRLEKILFDRNNILLLYLVCKCKCMIKERKK